MILEEGRYQNVVYNLIEYSNTINALLWAFFLPCNSGLVLLKIFYCEIYF